MSNANPEEKWYRFCPNCKTELERKVIDGIDRLACSSCDFILWSNPKPTTTILIVDGESKILMTQRTREPFKGWWCLPGGFIEYEESPEEAVKREGKEEVGLDVQNPKLVGVYQIDNDPRGMHIDIIYSAKLNGTVNANQEISEHKLFGKDKLPEKIAFKHREAINDYFNLPK